MGGDRLIAEKMTSGEEGAEGSSGLPTPADVKAQAAWPAYSAHDLKRTALSLHHDTSIHFRSVQWLAVQLKTQYKLYEDAFFIKLKDGIMHAKEHPRAAAAVTFAAGFLIFRGPRRFLFRHTFGRLQSEEARYSKAENRLKELNLSVDLFKKDSQKLKQRALLAEDEMSKGSTKLKKAGAEIQKLAKLIETTESQAADLVDGLREISGREAIKLRAEVASMASQLNQQKAGLNKQMLKISELGIPV